MPTHAPPAPSSQRLTKKQRIIVRHEKSKMTTKHVMGLQHPLGINPLGNYYMDASRPDFPGACRGPSLGQLSRLTDELIMDILHLLSPCELLTLGATSRVLYGLTHLDDMWKTLTIERFKGDWTWQGDTWRATFLKRSDPQYNTDIILENREALKLKYFYSDVLFQSFYCAAIGMDPYVSVENIDKRSGLTLDEFVQEYEKPGKPVIITDGAKHWPAMQKWSTDQRPDYRWLIVGPARSGSTFHKDPNATSAWNAVITGSKKWIMFPPHILPPGVFTNDDESEVTSPVSLMEWFSNFYASTQFPDDPAERPLEGICREGEIMFVPRGWWHAVVNLDDCIAVTQNYVGSQNLRETMEFLYLKRDQVSGVVDERREGLYEEFKDAFFKSNWTPEDESESSKDEAVLTEAEILKRKQLKATWVENERIIEQIAKKRTEQGSCCEAVSEKLSFWEQAKLGTSDKKDAENGTADVVESSGSGGFSFSFGFASDDEVEAENEEEQ
ncbi:hypothetical protein BGZ52_008441 [Haplosporangium bisporale]|nr:hypothetical protein BGZ52_008441 [Haplosporangium bisporale]